MADPVFTATFKDSPYWWDTTPIDTSPTPEIPTQADVAIVGSGYTGLHAAIQTARAGLSTVIFEAETPGYGCSTRNGGQVSTSIKPSFSTLAARHGPDLAKRILQEGQASLDFLADFIAAERLDAEFKVVGRFHGAHLAKGYDQLARDIRAENPAFDTNAFMVPKQDMASELGTQAYHGGVVFPRHASIDPGKYHRGLLKLARDAGVQIIPHCRVTELERQPAGFNLRTQGGAVRAGRVVMATNGYSGTVTPWHRRRIIPIGSYVIATDTLPRDLFDRLFPTDRVLSDTRKLVYYYRPSPDRSRILFGGRVSLTESNPRRTGPILMAELCRLFPDLTGTRISHSWMGTVGYTFDALAHVGQEDGLFYAMGYCGSGVGMASYLGMRIGQQVAGRTAGHTALNDIPFPTRPLYTGNPWFLAPSVIVYRVRDRFGW